MLISAGRWAKVAAVLPRLSFGLPALPAVKQVTEAIESARVAAALPIRHAEDATETHGDIRATRGPVRFYGAMMRIRRKPPRAIELPVSALTDPMALVTALSAARLAAGPPVAYWDHSRLTGR